jgi:hypothetical protein
MIPVHATAYTPTVPAAVMVVESGGGNSPRQRAYAVPWRAAFTPAALASLTLIWTDEQYVGALQSSSEEFGGAEMG